MLWTEKYRPETLSRMDFHPDVNARLMRMAKRDDFPHMLFYGPSGAGKRTRVLGLVRELFGVTPDHMQQTVCEYKVNSTTYEIHTLSSRHHIEVNLSDAGARDRAVVSELVSTIASTQTVDPSSSHGFKLLVLEDADQISPAAQHALRRTMETHSAACRMVLVASSASRIIAALKSRCVPVRVPRPSPSAMREALSDVAAREALDVEPATAAGAQDALDKVVAMSGGNYRKALLGLQALARRSHAHLYLSCTPVRPEWEQCVAQAARLAAAQPTTATLARVRASLFALLGNCVPPSAIMRALALELCGHTRADTQAFELVFWASKLDDRMQVGSHPIIHLEAFLAKAMALLAQAPA